MGKVGGLRAGGVLHAPRVHVFLQSQKMGGIRLAGGLQVVVKRENAKIIILGAKEALGGQLAA